MTMAKFIIHRMPSGDYRAFIATSDGERPITSAHKTVAKCRELIYEIIYGIQSPFGIEIEEKECE